jgi:hypothetical protein
VKICIEGDLLHASNAKTPARNHLNNDLLHASGGERRSASARAE